MERRNRHLFRNWLILFIILASTYLGAKIYWNHLLSPVSQNGQIKAFVVKEGEGSSTIADHLQSEGLIRSSFAFKTELKLTGEGSKLIPGDFKLSPSMSVFEIIDTLSKGPDDRWVTLLEGWRDEEIAAKLNKELGINKEDFLRVAKEGYMFPDTYLFNQKATADDIASTLKNTFNQRYTDDLQSKIRGLGLTPDQGVVLASIVEREGRSDEVRQQIASILLKRLRIGMALNVDATLQYALGYSSKEQTWWRGTITANDKKIDSPFNTYLNAGLPPAPICNPSSASLKAVASANPSTPYLYYYVDSKGKIYYATTREQHDANVANHP